MVILYLSLVHSASARVAWAGHVTYVCMGHPRAIITVLPHVQTSTRPSPFSACNIENVGVAWGRGYTKLSLFEDTTFKMEAQLLYYDIAILLSYTKMLCLYARAGGAGPVGQAKPDHFLARIR
jgi:hypothetical protein